MPECFFFPYCHCSLTSDRKEGRKKGQYNFLKKLTGEPHTHKVKIVKEERSSMETKIVILKASLNYTWRQDNGTMPQNKK